MQTAGFLKLRTLFERVASETRSSGDWKKIPPSPFPYLRLLPPNQPIHRHPIIHFVPVPQRNQRRRIDIDLFPLVGSGKRKNVSAETHIRALRYPFAVWRGEYGFIRFNGETVTSLMHQPMHNTTITGQSAGRFSTNVSAVCQFRFGAVTVYA